MASALKIALPVNEHAVPGPESLKEAGLEIRDGSAPTWAQEWRGGRRQSSQMVSHFSRWLRKRLVPSSPSQAQE